MRNRFFRCLICLVLVAAMLVYVSPLQAKATAAGGAAIVKASTVTGNPYIIAGAAIVALGVMVGTESGAFETLVDNAVSYLDSAGAILADGTMQLLKTVTDAGTVIYYLAGDLFETMRSWLFDSGAVYNSVASLYPEIPSDVIAHAQTYPHYAICKPDSTQCDWTIFANSAGFYISGDYSFNESLNKYYYPSGIDLYASGAGASYHIYNDGTPSSWGKVSKGGFAILLEKGWYETIPALQYGIYETGVNDLFLTDKDLTLGNVSSVPIDGTSARTWAPDVADRNGLYVKYNNDPEPPDDNNGKWFWRLALPLTIAELIAMSQADEWTGETPEEFPAGDTVTEFEILDRPEIDGYQGIEVSPVTDPNPDTGGDSGEDPDTGGDTDPTAPGEPTTDPDADPDPDPEGGLDPDPDPGTDPDAGGDTGSDTGGDLVDVKPVNFFLDLRNYFPFCIPFDIAAFIGALVAPAEAPVFHWELQDLSGNVYPIDVDLSPWDAHAQLFRDVQLVLFIIGLALITRNMIKW